VPFIPELYLCPRRVGHSAMGQDFWQVQAGDADPVVRHSVIDVFEAPRAGAFTARDGDPYGAGSPLPRTRRDSGTRPVPRLAALGWSFGDSGADDALAAEGTHWQMPFRIAGHSLAEAALKLVREVAPDRIAAIRAIKVAEGAQLQVAVVLPFHSPAEAALKLARTFHLGTASK
jgi:hypothetical protein